MTRASDEPIRPMPMRAIFSNSGVWHGVLAFQEFGERGDDAAIGFFGADGHAQRVGKAVAGNAPQDIAARRQECVGRRRRMLAVVRENGSARNCRRSASPAARAWSTPRVSQAQPVARCARRLRSTCARSRIAATPASIAAALTLNGPAHAVQRIDDVRPAHTSSRCAAPPRP